MSKNENDEKNLDIIKPHNRFNNVYIITKGKSKNMQH